MYENLMRKANVVSVGWGYRTVGGVQQRGELPCLVVGVTRKVPLSFLERNDRIPHEVGGITTDVVEVGVIRALEAPTNRHRPAMPGISIGHPDVTAGTFGCLVKKDGVPHILSNNHVMANSNRATIGDPIYQPGTADGGNSSDVIASLTAFETIVFGDTDIPDCPIVRRAAECFNLAAKLLGRKHRLRVEKRMGPQAVNWVDAAIARPSQFQNVTSPILNIGQPAGVGEATLGLVIQKSGRTTGYTTGTVLQIGATVRVQYGAGEVATFEDQIIAGQMSAGGDSGSAVLDMDRNLVGLLFAGSTQTTILNPMSEVFAALGLTL